jgi:uncharacterized membrane protein YphA (DoxX/SURF4 family)
MTSTPSTQSKFAVVQPWIGLVARLILGGALLIAGALKLPRLDLALVAFRAYEFHLPSGLEYLIGYGQPIVETILGLLIIVGFFTRWTALVGGVVMLAFIGAIISVWARGMSIDCGCFTPGGYLDANEKTAYALDIARDTGFLICAVWLVIFPKTRLSLDAWIHSPIDKES